MSSPAAEVFYAARDQRTAQVGGQADALRRPVSLIVGADVASTRTGQVAATAAVNMLARAHRELHITVPAVPALALGLAQAADLPALVRETVLAINPHLALTVSSTNPPAGSAGGVSAGIGLDVPDGLDLYVGWAGGRGEISVRPVPATFADDGLIGAATASCLLAAGIFRICHGSPAASGRINLAERTHGVAAGATTVTGPIDTGDTLLVGAGAVGQALLYWARELGVVGRWIVADGDVCKIHNTNRCLGMTARDAGWPHGEPGGPEASKAEVAAALIGATAFPHWYDEWAENEIARPDLVLPLANERAVRALVAGRGEPILLHATTSPNWSAQLHRHVVYRDDCPSCRLDTGLQPAFACSTGPAAPEQPTSSDAALPFVPAMAGLQLAVALLHLPSAGSLLTDAANHWAVDLTLPANPWLSSRHPAGSCVHVLIPAAQARVHAEQPRRWDALSQVC
jgi:hypothetical protein